jgi:hypothetical protein
MTFTPSAQESEEQDSGLSKEQIAGEMPALHGATLSPRERVRRGKERHIA